MLVVKQIEEVRKITLHVFAPAKYTVSMPLILPLVNTLDTAGKSTLKLGNLPSLKVTH